MSTTLTPKSPPEFPAPITLPDPGTSHLPSVATNATLTQLADRTDALKNQFRAAVVNGTNSTASTGTWVDISGASVSLGTCAVGDVVIALGLGTKITSGTQARLQVTDGSTTITISTFPGVATITAAGTWTLKVQQYHATSGTVQIYSAGVLVRARLP